MKDLPMPKAWTERKAIKAAIKDTLMGKKNVQAATLTAGKLDMGEEVAGQGLCPDCRKPMEECFVSDIPAMTCNPCRIVLPRPDTEEYTASLQAKVEAQAPAMDKPATNMDPTVITPDC